jgi:hypothetical protein
MMCSCGEQHHRTFPARIQYSVYFDANRRTVPAVWTQEELWVYLACGNISSAVPDAELNELRAGPVKARNHQIRISQCPPCLRDDRFFRISYC